VSVDGIDPKVVPRSDLSCPAPSPVCREELDQLVQQAGGRLQLHHTLSAFRILLPV
jgi:hypothetical protein